jgi:hypothetical protein
VSDHAEMLARMREAFATAAGARPGEVAEQRVRLAGRPVLFRVAGAALVERTLPPLRHLFDRDPDGDPELTVELWDELATGVPMPVPLPDDPFEQAGERWIAHCAPGLTTVLDRTGGVIAGWRANAFAAPEEGWRTLPWILPVWYLDGGVQVVHAGLVGLNGAGVLIAGEGGSGKSTTCLAAATAGLEFLGDDFVGIEEDGGGWTGYSLSSTSRTTYDTLERHPEIAGGLEVSESEGKNIVFIDPEGTRASIPIAGILLPRLGGERVQRTPASGGAVVSAFLPTSLILVVGTGAERMARLGRLARGLPAQWIEAAGPPQDVAAEVRRALEELTGA